MTGLMMARMREGVLLGAICVALTLFGGRAHAALGDFTGESGVWEISLPPAVEIKDQGKYPYCGLYAMASYLELWGKGGRPSYAYPSVDESFLAMGYNRTIGAGSQGTHPVWLAVSTQLYGAIPEGARSRQTTEFPRQRWEREHLGLLDKDLLKDILQARYEFGSLSRPFLGREFVAALGVDFRGMLSLESSQTGMNMRAHPILCRPSEDRTEMPDAPLRHGDIRRTVETMERLAVRVGIDPRFAQVPPNYLYRAIGKQLYKGRPVYLGINVGLTEKAFAAYRLIRETDLVPAHQGKLWMHAVVAVAHCDKQESRSPICRKFARYLERKGSESCIVIQNSWGPEVHDQGYVCATAPVIERITHTAIIDKRIVTR